MRVSTYTLGEQVEQIMICLHDYMFSTHQASKEVGPTMPQYYTLQYTDAETEYYDLGSGPTYTMWEAIEQRIMCFHYAKR